MQTQVEIFRHAFGLPNSNTPRHLTKDEALLHYRMIRDEVLDELLPAIEENNTLEIYDASIDVIYYILGMLSNMGVDIRPGFNEVQESNMSKLDEDGKPIYAVEGDGSGEPPGKVLKGPFYFQPNLRRVLEEQGLKLEEREGLF